MARRWIPYLLVLVLGLGCDGTTETKTKTKSIEVHIVEVEFRDLDGNGGVSGGDSLTITFDRRLTVLTVLAPHLADPAVEFDLPVTGDSFGVGASLKEGPGSSQITITLGTAVFLRVTGEFSPSDLGPSSPSALALPAFPTGVILTSDGVQAKGVEPMDILGTGGTTVVEYAGLANPRGRHTSTLLGDGRVLV